MRRRREGKFDWEMNEWIDESSAVFVKMVREIGLWVRIEREDDKYPCQRSII